MTTFKEVFDIYTTPNIELKQNLTNIHYQY